MYGGSTYVVLVYPFNVDNR